MDPTLRDEIMKGVEWDTFPSSKKGGQMAGVPKGVTLSHPDYGFSVTVAEHRSQIENKHMAVYLFEMFLDQIHGPV